MLTRGNTTLWDSIAVITTGLSRTVPTTDCVGLARPLLGAMRRGVSELTCVELFLWILKPFFAVCRYARMEAKANQDRKRRWGEQLEFGCSKVHVHSSGSTRKAKVPCPVSSLTHQRVVVSCCEWPGGAKRLRHWSDLRGSVRGPGVSVEPWCVCVACVACLAFSTGGRTSGTVRVPGPK